MVTPCLNHLCIASHFTLVGSQQKWVVVFKLFRATISCVESWKSDRLMFSAMCWSRTDLGMTPRKEQTHVIVLSFKALAFYHKGHSLIGYATLTILLSIVSIIVLQCALVNKLAAVFFFLHFKASVRGLRLKFSATGRLLLKHNWR